jgi:hypothetical protein
MAKDNFLSVPFTGLNGSHAAVGASQPSIYRHGSLEAVSYPYRLCAKVEAPRIQPSRQGLRRECELTHQLCAQGRERSC